MMARGPGRRDKGALAEANARGGNGIVDSSALGSTPSGGAWGATRRRAAVRALLLLGQPARIERQFHNQPEHWELLVGHLRAAQLGTRRLSDDLGLLKPQTLAGCDVLLNYTSETDPAPEQVAALLAAVEGGMGFTVRFVDGDHEITRGLADYDHEDELYELTADVEERQKEVPLQGVRVLAEAEGHPMVYVKAHGAGRVVYLAMGHDRRSLGRPTYRTLFVRAVAWAARRRPASAGAV
jgi:hypothetical protein